VGGGVPHFTDYNKHVRLGDVVVSAPTENQKYEMITISAIQIAEGVMKSFQFISGFIHPQVRLSAL